LGAAPFFVLGAELPESFRAVPGPSTALGVSEFIVGNAFAGLFY